MRETELIVRWKSAVFAGDWYGTRCAVEQDRVGSRLPEALRVAIAVDALTEGLRCVPKGASVAFQVPFDGPGPVKPLAYFLLKVEGVAQLFQAPFEPETGVADLSGMAAFTLRGASAVESVALAEAIERAVDAPVFGTVDYDAALAYQQTELAANPRRTQYRGACDATRAGESGGMEWIDTRSSALLYAGRFPDGSINLILTGVAPESPEWAGAQTIGFKPSRNAKTLLREGPQVDLVEMKQVFPGAELATAPVADVFLKIAAAPKVEPGEAQLESEEKAVDPPRVR